MRIISKFRDYYDGPSYDWPEDDLIYIRNQKCQILAQCDNYFRYRSVTLGFCGKIYYGINLTNFLNKARDIDSTRYNLVFSFQELSNYVKSNVSDKEFKKLNTDYYGSLKRTKKTFEECKHWKFDESLECPIYIYCDQFDSNEWCHNKCLIKNPCLKNFQFYKVFDTIAAYQEISMFLGNGRAAREYVPEMDNKTKIEQHGFDIKESFRNVK